MSYQIGEWIPLSEARRLPSIPGVYIIRNTVNAKEYVGLSANVHRRLVDHLRKPVEGRYLYRAIARHGMATFQVCLFVVAQEAKLPALEIATIAERRSFAPKGYNLTVGGEGRTGAVCRPETREKLRQANLGKRVSEETRLRMSAANLGRKLPQGAIEKIRLARLGSTRTLETLERMRIASTGRPKSEETRRKIGVASLGHKLSEGAKEKIRKANTGKRHSEETRAKISAVQVGKKASEETRARMREASRAHAAKLMRPVLLWEMESLTPKVFESALAASKYLGTSLQNVSAWCLGKRPKRFPVAVCYSCSLE